MPTKSRNRRSPKKLARRMSSKTTRHLSRRKGSARARNPKKLRGGVTRRRLSQLTQQELFAVLEELQCRRQFRGKVGSDGFEKVLIGMRGARETLLQGRKGRAAKNSVVTSGAKQLKC